jgi:transposase InsO family protein
VDTTYLQQKIKTAKAPRLRDEFLNGEIFYSMKEIRVLAERWRVHYNTIRPHSSLGYRPPAPQDWAASRLPTTHTATI